MKWLCVYCGSSMGNLNDYESAARELGELMVARGIGLVYGGASVGIMGVIADTVLNAGGEAIGIMPKALVDKEIAHGKLTRLEVVTSMHERKARMAELSDGFIALPGGFGTLEELFEVLTWGQLGFHQKPCGLLDVRNYYQHLVTFFDQTVTSGFLKPVHRDLLITSDSPVTLLDEMNQFEPDPEPGKWITRENL